MPVLLRATATILLLCATALSAPAQSTFRILSRGHGQGFVFMANGDTLGYTTQGDYDEALLPPQLKALIAFWKERPPRSNRHRLSSYKSGWTDVAPLTATHWHQGEPYNLLTPLVDGQHCPAGCVATAGAQVAYYFHRDNPDTLLHATPVYGQGNTAVSMSLPAGTPLEWQLMPLQGSGTAAQDQAVATLVYALATTAGLAFSNESTSGYDERMAYALSRQLRLLCSYRQKATLTQRAWEELIYANLSSGRPMLCSGLSPKGSGHTVVLDGYQASTGLYHFNFGWGGQGDGWYTVDDETGIDGYSSAQALVCDITPRMQNLKGHLAPTPLYEKTATTVTATVTNQGTLTYSGFHLFVNTEPALPLQPSAIDHLTDVAPGQTASLDFSFTPTAQGNAYLFLCDKNRHIIDSCRVCIETALTDVEAILQPLRSHPYNLSGQPLGRHAYSAIVIGNGQRKSLNRK